MRKSAGEGNARGHVRWSLASVVLSLGQVIVTYAAGLYFRGHGGFERGSRTFQLVGLEQVVLWGLAAMCLYVGFKKEARPGYNFAALCVLMLSLLVGVAATAV
jgi:hypothetical protein